MPRIFISQSALLALLGALLVSGCGDFNPFGSPRPDQTVEGPRRAPALNSLSTAQQPGAASSPVVLQTQPVAPTTQPMQTATTQPAVASAPVPAASTPAPATSQSSSQSSNPFDGISAWWHKHIQPSGTTQTAQSSSQQADSGRRSVPGNPDTSGTPAPQAMGAALPPPPPPPTAGQQLTPLEPAMAQSAPASIPAPPQLTTDTKSADADLKARCAELTPVKAKTTHHRRHKAHKLASKKKHATAVAKKEKKDMSQAKKAAPVTKVNVADKGDYPQLSNVPNPPVELSNVKATQAQQQQNLNAAKAQQDQKNDALQKEFFQSIVPPQAPAVPAAPPAAPTAPGGVAVQFPAPAAPVAPAAVTPVAPAAPALPAPPVPAAPQPAAAQPVQNAVPAPVPAPPVPPAPSAAPASAMPLPPPPPPPPPPGASLDQPERTAA